MIIQVLHTYGGRLTKREKILPGVYDTEHDALYGIAQYLVDNGHAVIVADSLSASQEAPEAEDTPSLSELRTRYKELSGKGASPKWDAETLLEKIAELEDSESGNA